MKYRTKPVEVEAIQWTGKNLREVKSFLGKAFNYHNKGESLDYIFAQNHTNLFSKNMVIYLNHWIVRNFDGSFTTHTPEVFEQQYEKVE